MALRPIQTPTTTPMTSTATVPISVATSVVMASPHRPVAMMTPRQMAAVTAERRLPKRPARTTMATAASHHGESVNSACNGLNAWMVNESLRALVVDPRCSCTQSTDSVV